MNPQPQKSKKSEPSSTPDPVMSALEQALKVINNAAEINERMSAREQPLLDFHAAVEHAIDTDARIYWDVRIVTGKDTPFTQSIGSASLPGILSDKQLPHATGIIEQEIKEKISGPVAAAFMEAASKSVAVNLSRIARRQLVEPESTPNQGEAVDLLALASQHADSVAGNSEDHADD